MKVIYTLLGVLFFSVSLLPQNFFPVQEGDSLHYQYIYNETSHFPPYSYTNYHYLKGIAAPKQLDTITYLKVLDAYYYYNQQQQKLYTIVDSQKTLSADFNTPSGGYFYGSPLGEHPAMYRSNGISNGVFFCSRDTDWVPNTVGGSLHFSFNENKGLNYSDYYYNSSQEISKLYTLIEMKGHINFTFQKPTLAISSYIAGYRYLNEFPFDISFSKNHKYAHLIDSLCVFINVYRNNNLVISITSFPTTAAPDKFPINLTSSELQVGDVVKLQFLMTDTALFKNRIILPENGTIDFTVVEPTSTTWYLQNPYPVSTNLYGMHFTTPEKGWVVGDAGVILKTTDAGDTWNDFSTNKKYNLKAVCFTDNYNGTVVGDLASVSEGGTILRTYYGGLVWVKQVSGILDNIINVSFSEVNKGSAAYHGWAGTLLNTTNGGSTWFDNGLTGVKDILYLDSEVGIAVGYTTHGVIYKTTNGGTSWMQKASISPGLNCVRFVNQNIGFAGGDYLMKTRDRGDTWTIQGYYHPTTKISFINENTGLSLRSGLAERTTDGGETWMPLTTGTNNLFNDVIMLSSSEALLSGQNGTIMKSTDGGINWFSISKGFNYHLYGSFSKDASTAWVVGLNGKMLKTTNGGRDWIEQPSGTNKTLFDIYFSDSNTGTAVGEQGTIIKTTDGGLSWNTLTSGTTSNLNSVYFLDSNNGVSVGSNSGIFLKTTNGGNSWISKSFLIDLNSVSFTDINTGTIAGKNGYISRTTDGGVTWNLQQSGIQEAIFDVEFKDDNNGMAVGFKRILKTTNSGSTWTPVYTSQNNLNLLSVKYIDETNLIAVGDAGVVLRSSDSGSLWVPDKINTTNTLYDAAFTNISNGYVVGQDGLIFSTKYVTSIDDEDFGTEINNYNISQNYPNPFNPSTSINYSIPATTKIKIAVFDILGREIAVLVNEEKSAGNHTVNFNGSNLSSGIYFYQLRAGNFSETKKMILLK